jgi:hypothetical protein
MNEAIFIEGCEVFEIGVDVNPDCYLFQPKLPARILIRLFTFICSMCSISIRQSRPV